MKAKHTPATARQAIERAYLDGYHAGFERATVWERGLEFAVDAASEYATANSEPLLDAAPDLLKELEFALCVCPQSMANSPWGDWARAAIAKARGETP